MSKIHILKYGPKIKETLIEHKLIKCPSQTCSLSFFLLKPMWKLNSICCITYQQMQEKHLLGSQPHPPAASPVRSQGACQLHCQGQECHTLPVPHSHTYSDRGILLLTKYHWSEHKLISSAKMTSGVFSSPRMQDKSISISFNVHGK